MDQGRGAAAEHRRRAEAPGVTLTCVPVTVVGDLPTPPCAAGGQPGSVSAIIHRPLRQQSGMGMEEGAGSPLCVCVCPTGIMFSYRGRVGRILVLLC